MLDKKFWATDPDRNYILEYECVGVINRDNILILITIKSSGLESGADMQAMFVND